MCVLLHLCIGRSVLEDYVFSLSDEAFVYLFLDDQEDEDAVVNRIS